MFALVFSIIVSLGVGLVIWNFQTIQTYLQTSLAVTTSSITGKVALLFNGIKELVTKVFKRTPKVDPRDRYANIPHPSRKPPPPPPPSPSRKQTEEGWAMYASSNQLPVTFEEFFRWKYGHRFDYRNYSGADRDRYLAEYEGYIVFVKGMMKPVPKVSKRYY